MSSIDLHARVVPPTVVEAVRRDPQRFGINVVERNGKLYFAAMRRSARHARGDPGPHAARTGGNSGRNSALAPGRAMNRKENITW
jgi:hypothetical protein